MLRKKIKKREERGEKKNDRKVNINLKKLWLRKIQIRNIIEVGGPAVAKTGLASSKK